MIHYKNFKKKNQIIFTIAKITLNVPMTYLHYLTFERFNTKYLFSQKEECNWNVSEEEKEKDNHPMSC